MGSVEEGNGPGQEAAGDFMCHEHDPSGKLSKFLILGGKESFAFVDSFAILLIEN